MTMRTILFLSLWAQGMAQEVQSAGDDEDMKQLVEMLSDDKVLDQVVDKLTDRLSQNVDLSAMMDETTLAKAAAPAKAPPKKAATKKAPPQKQGGSLLDSFAQAWENMGGGVTPTFDRNTGSRGTFEYKKKALPTPMSQGAFGGPKPMAKIGGARPVSNMRAPFMLDEEPTDSDSVNVFAVLALSFFAGVAITLAVHKFRQGPSKDSTLQGYAPLHD